VQLRALERQPAAFEESIADGPEGGSSLEEIIDVLATYMATELPQEVGGLVRAIMTQGMRGPAMRERVALVWAEGARRRPDVLRQRAAAHTHPRPDSAAELIVRTLNGLLLQLVLFERPLDDRLPAELRTLLFRYHGMAV